MLFTILLIAQVVVCVLLVAIVLMQSGRGGGLTETFAGGMESMFGSKTNVIMVRTTAILSILFFTTCLSLAFLSTQKSKSLMASEETVAVGDVVDDIEEAVPSEVQEKVEEVAEQVQSEEESDKIQESGTE